MTDQRAPLCDQTALVTGASSGIGAATAVALARAGAKVGVNYNGSAERASEGCSPNRGGRGSGDRSEGQRIEKD
jgi:3-oxoacyl-[acyl-carrier protein] reductase